MIDKVAGDYGLLITPYSVMKPIDSDIGGDPPE
jgi:hypothetical protein